MNKWWMCLEKNSWRLYDLIHILKNSKPSVSIATESHKHDVKGSAFWGSIGIIYKTHWSVWATCISYLLLVHVFLLNRNLRFGITIDSVFVYSKGLAAQEGPHMPIDCIWPAVILSSSTEMIEFALCPNSHLTRNHKGHLCVFQQTYGWQGIIQMGNLSNPVSLPIYFPHTISLFLHGI